jgi:hypothetical protein
MSQCVHSATSYTPATKQCVALDDRASRMTNRSTLGIKNTSPLHLNHPGEATLTSGSRKPILQVQKVAHPAPSVEPR